MSFQHAGASRLAAAAAGVHPPATPPELSLPQSAGSGENTVRWFRLELSCTDTRQRETNRDRGRAAPFILEPEGTQVRPIRGRGKQPYTGGRDRVGGTREQKGKRGRRSKIKQEVTTRTTWDLTDFPDRDSRIRPGVLCENWK